MHSDLIDEKTPDETKHNLAVINKENTYEP
jgi:hypothetical protein